MEELKSTDKALQMLNELFGEGWHNLLWNQEISGEATLIYDVLHGFNIFVLFGIAAMLIYVVSHGLIGSAHEGKFLGSRLHSIWVPIRGVMGIGMLTPLSWAKGLSLIQVIILAFVGFSVQAANMVCEKGMDYLGKHEGSVQSYTPDIRKNVELAAATALKAATVQYHQGYFQNSSNVGYDIINDPKKLNIDFFAPKGLDANDMGAVSITCESQSNLCQARKNGIKNLVQNIYPIAEQLILSRHPSYSADRPAKDQYNEVIDQYVDNINAAIDKDWDTSGYSAEYSEFQTMLDECGFFVLGEYYWTLTRFNMRALEEIGNTVESVSIKSNNITEKTSPIFNSINTSIELAENYEIASLEDRQNIAEYGQEKPEGASGAIKKVVSLMSAPIMPLTDQFLDLIINEDPVVSLATAGHYIISGSETIFVSYVVAKGVAAAGAKATSTGAVGWAQSIFTGNIASALTAMARVIINAFAPLVFILVGSLFMLGVTLGYYIPILPFMLWVTAIIGWVILVVEALVAGPLWAAAHVVPEGEGIAGEHGKQGYLLFMHVLMYPILLVIGFFLAMLGTHLVKYVGEGFQVFFHGYMGQYALKSFLTSLIALFLCGWIMVILYHKIFGLITLIPDQVFKWLGGTQGHNIGGKDEEQKFTSGFGTIRDRMQSGVERGVGHASHRGKSDNEGDRSGSDHSEYDHQSGKTGY